MASEKRVFTLDMVNDKDIELMELALGDSSRRRFFCFGKSHGKLRALNLVDEESYVTPDGRKFLMDNRKHD